MLRAARVIVPDYQLSLAIGKEGQNARLAAKLTGWRIDIRSDTARPGGRGRRVAAPAPGSRGGTSSADRPRGGPGRRVRGAAPGARAAAQPVAGAPLAAGDRSRR